MPNTGPTSFEGTFSRLAIFLPLLVYNFAMKYRDYELHDLHRTPVWVTLSLVLGLYAVSFFIIRIATRSFAVYIFKFVLTVTAGVITILYWPAN